MIVIQSFIYEWMQDISLPCKRALCKADFEEAENKNKFMIFLISVPVIASASSPSLGLPALWKESESISCS